MIQFAAFVYNSKPPFVFQELWWCHMYLQILITLIQVKVLIK